MRSLMWSTSFDISLCQSRLVTACCASRRRRGSSQGRRGGRKLIDVIKDRLEQHRGRNDPIHHPFGEPGDRLFLAMHQEHATSNRPPRRDPSRELRAVGVARVIVDGTDARRHADFITLNSHRLGAVQQEPAKGAVGLKSGQQHRRPSIP